MPCEACNTQFTIFKRKQACPLCQRLYCQSCLIATSGNKKTSKKICKKCLIFETRPAPNKEILMQLKTKDLVFYLQSRKINFAGAVEKEELANLIINHANTNSYYESHSSTSTTPNNDFEQSFDQIKQTCQNLFTSISDKIASDFQKTTCFTQQSHQPNRPPTTEQPRRSASAQRSHPVTPQTPLQPPSRGETSNHSVPTPSGSGSGSSNHQHDDCDCQDDEIQEISDKRQSIFNGNPGPSGCQVNAKVTNSSSSDSSSFEEVEPKLDDWEVIEKTASNGISARQLSNNVSSPHQSSNDTMTRSLLPEPSLNPELRRLTRRRSDSSLLNLRKSSSITIDTSTFDPTQSCSEVKKLKISCNKCGKAKSNIKREILKLSEQLKTSNKSETEVNAKIKEFLDYLESKSQPSEMTETEDSQTDDNQEGARFIPPSRSSDDIEEEIFDENEGINVYASMADENQSQESSTSTPRRFISLNDIRSSNDLETLNVKQLKEILMLNRVDFKGCCEKQELKERVKRLWQDHVAAPPSEKLPSDDLCKICMDAGIECVFLECGHSVTCVTCGKVLSECPICRSYIVRVVRIFKS